MRERERARAGEPAQVSPSENEAAMRLPGGALARMRENGRHRLWQRPDEIVFDRRAALPWLQLPQNLDKHPVSCGGESASRWSQSTPAAACEQHTHGCRAAMSVPARHRRHRRRRASKQQAAAGGGAGRTNAEGEQGAEEGVGAGRARPEVEPHPDHPAPLIRATLPAKFRLPVSELRPPAVPILESRTPRNARPRGAGNTGRAAAE